MFPFIQEELHQGVPQGSIMVPLLILLSVGDLPEMVGDEADQFVDYITCPEAELDPEILSSCGREDGSLV